MENTTCELIDAQIDLTVPGIAFTKKPLIFGGMAMEYYGLRKHGDDVDFIVSFEDYAKLAEMYPDCRKDMWGDLGVLYKGYEMFRTVWKLDYEFLSRGSVEYRDYRVISIDMLLLMKALAAGAGEKHLRDVDLVARHMIRNGQRPDITEFMNSHIKSYLASPDGIVYKGEY